jgi:hypothetical protein
MVGCAWSAMAHAYRPFESTDASIVDVGLIEIELGPVAYTDAPLGSIVELPTLTLNAGLSSRWEFVIDATRAIARFSGTSVETVETALSLKGIVKQGALQDADGWSVATEFGVLLPARNGDDDYGAALAVIGSRRGGDSMLHLNAAISQTREGNTELFSGLVLEGSADARVRPVLELTFGSEDDTENRSWSALLGAIWRYGKALSFDVAARAIRESGAWSYQGRFGLTWIFALT